MIHGDGAPDIREVLVVSRRTRMVGWLFAVSAVVMVPWTILLAIHLPKRELARHYDLAWAGFDAGLFLLLAATGWTAVRRSRWLPVAASANATLLVVDAWFDVVTAPTTQHRVLAVLMALLVELPLAAVCVWLAVNGQDLVERRVELRLRRQGLQARASRRQWARRRPDQPGPAEPEQPSKTHTD